MCRSWQRERRSPTEPQRVATSMRTNTSSPTIAVRIRESVGFAVLSAAITRARHERDARGCPDRRRGRRSLSPHPGRAAASSRSGGRRTQPASGQRRTGQQLLRTLKNDARDCGAMAELLIPVAGVHRNVAMRHWSGRPPGSRTGAAGRRSSRVSQPNPRAARSDLPRG